MQRRQERIESMAKSMCRSRGINPDALTALTGQVRPAWMDRYFDAARACRYWEDDA